ncbi:MAG: hypothetical protein MJZ36_01055 [Bacteroidaceae bacterium]|nr:hypothetical protein [Bacteroidaceae bacterium]
MEQKEYLDSYESALMQHMLKMLTSMQLLDGKLLESADITDKWDEVAPAYVADSVKEIADYPSVALGWAMYLGMAVARYWDEEWSTYGCVPNLYEYLRDKRGYDYMDEVVRGEVLLLKGEEYDRMETVVQGCAQQVLAKIRHEQIEPQSPLAFHVYARSIRVLYLIGASVELKALGYKWEEVRS